MLRLSEQLPTNEVHQTKPRKHRKAGEYRDVPLPTFVYKEIKRHLAEHGTSDDGYFFRGPTRFLCQDVYRDHFRRARQAAGLPEGFRSHDLRHYFASIALHRGIPITEVSMWLGHRDIRTTHDLWAHGSLSLRPRQERTSMLSATSLSHLVLICPQPSQA
ncbi:tyrosine-type recombinase/integrase [Thermomonospora curvata]|uniref:tyrosine-type recombinase/integrase n=1 Tax=Thermomonospora curvata TaxID=2020 RepID=UPI00019EC5A2